MSTENNAESAQDGVQMTSAGESGPPDATNATPVSVSARRQRKRGGDA